MSISPAEVPVAGVIVDAYELALVSILFRTLTMFWLLLRSSTRMCACLNCRLFGMMEKWMCSSVAFAGNGKVVVFLISARMSSGLVLIGTVKWTKVGLECEYC